MAALACACGLGATLAGEPRAHAHVGHVVMRAERYLKLDASEADTRLVVSLMLGEVEGERVLADADANGDRSVTPEEADAYLRQWAEGLRTELPVWIDRAPVSLVWTEGWLDPLGRVRRTGVTLELVAHLPVEAREHRIEVEDRMVRREIFDRTDVAFRAHDGARLAACGIEPEPSGCEDADFAFVRGGVQPSRFVVQVLYPDRPERLSWEALAGALAGLAVLIALALASRRHCGARKRRGPGTQRRAAPPPPTIQSRNG